MLRFPLCRESVLGMPRTETEFEINMVFCFGIRLALYAVFIIIIIIFFFSLSLGFTFNTLHAAESDRPINIVFVRPYVRPFFRLYIYLLDTLWIARYNCHVNQRKIQNQ